MCANGIEVSDGLHGGGGKHFAGGGAEDDGRDHGRGGPETGQGSRGGNRHCGCSSAICTADCAVKAASGLSVRDGPWATNPTPTVMSTIPAQRSREMGS